MAFQVFDFCTETIVSKFRDVCAGAGGCSFTFGADTTRTFSGFAVSGFSIKVLLNYS